MKNWYIFELIATSMIVCNAGCAVSNSQFGSSLVEQSAPYQFADNVIQTWYFEHNKIFAHSVSNDGLSSIVVYDGEKWNTIVEWNPHDYFRCSINTASSSISYVISVDNKYCLYKYNHEKAASELLHVTAEPILSIVDRGNGDVLVSKSDMRIYIINSQFSNLVLQATGMASPIMAATATLCAIALSDIDTGSTTVKLAANDFADVYHLNLNYRVLQLGCSVEGKTLFVLGEGRDNQSSNGIYVYDITYDTERRVVSSTLAIVIETINGMRHSPDGNIVICNNGDKVHIYERHDKTWKLDTGFSCDWNIFENHGLLQNNMINVSSTKSGIISKYFVSNNR